MTSHIVSAILPTTANFEAVYLVDNKRAGFLYDSVRFARSAAPGSDVRFAYIESGKVLNPAERSSSGTVLPIEYVNLGLLPMRAEDPNTRATRLMLFSIDPFTAEHLGRLIGFAQSLAHDWAGAIDICFPDFNPLTHSNEVGRIKNAFVDKAITARTEVRSYRPEFNN